MSITYVTRHVNRTAEDIAAGKYGAWQLIQPVSESIGIYDGKEKYDSDSAQFTAAQRRASAWIRYNNEVFDGGHRQFLVNSVGMVWKDALECMEMIGAVKSANRFRKIVNAFGGSIPFDKNERTAAFDRLWNEQDGTFHALLEKCDEEYTFGDRANKIVEMLTEYIKTHPQEFALDRDIQRVQGITYIIKRIIRTAEEIAAGRYSVKDLTDPLWNEIVTYKTKADYDRGAARFTAAQRMAFAWDLYNSEVLNGGHQQFLINSAGIVWKDALECMDMLGADKAADNFRKVVKAFGGAIPFERNERSEAFDALWERRNKTFPALLSKCDKEYFSNNYSDKTEKLLLDYIKAHPQEFALDREITFAE